MYGKVALSLSVAALILAGGGFLALLRRLDRMAGPSSEPAGRPPGVVPAEPRIPAGDPLAGTDLVAKANHLIQRIQKFEEDSYEYYSDITQDLFALKREVGHLKTTLRHVVQGLGRGSGGLLGIVGFFVLLIWSMKRHRDPKFEVDCSAPIEELVPSLAGLTLGSVVAGNSVEVLENEAFFDALMEEIGKARSSVHFETFLWKEGKLGSRLSEALIGRARAGVDVRVLLDATVSPPGRP